MYSVSDGSSGWWRVVVIRSKADAWPNVATGAPGACACGTRLKAAAFLLQQHESNHGPGTRGGPAVLPV